MMVKDFRFRVNRMKGVGLCLLIIVLLLQNRYVLAQGTVDVVNEQTGFGSENFADVNIDQSTVVEMVNEGTIVNEINLGINTGENQANENNGDSDVKTGDVVADVIVKNEGNVNDASLFKGKDLSITVENSETGADSENFAKVNIESNVDISTENHQSTVNEVNVKANSGKNQINGNGSDVRVETGEIKVKIAKSTDVNRTKLAVDDCCFGNVSLNVINKKTGVGSDNIVEVNVKNDVSIEERNELKVVNISNGELNTGENEINENSGEVFVSTGEINVNVDNEIVSNENEVVVDCCGVKIDDPGDSGDSGVGGPVDSGDPDNGEKPINQPAVVTSGGSNGNSSNGSNSGNGLNATAVGGMVLGAMLPATGNPYLLTVWMIGLFLISMGRFVRLMSGRAPGYVYVK